MRTVVLGLCSRYLHFYLNVYDVRIHTACIRYRQLSPRLLIAGISRACSGLLPISRTPELVMPARKLWLVYLCFQIVIVGVFRLAEVKTCLETQREQILE